MARFRREAIARGPLPVRTREASSPNVASLTWCSRFRATDSAGSGRGLVVAEPEVQILRVARHASQRTAGLLEQREPLCRRLKTVRAVPAL